ncbi:MAG: amino acid-binding protein [Acidimicrobiia bacterium]|nr:amino acid-binding protein [Acidimicrobiia bacterium]
MAFDLVIEIPNVPGALEKAATAISDAGVNIAAATCTGPADTAQLHILVPHAEAAKHALRISNLAVTSEREVVVVQAKDRPGELADLARKVARAGVNLDLVYVATGSRVVFGADDFDALKAALAQS